MLQAPRLQRCVKARVLDDLTRLQGKFARAPLVGFCERAFALVQ